MKQLKTRIKEASQVCSECGNKYGTYPKGHICGWWQGKCDICGKETTLTSVRDYRYLNKVLDRKGNIIKGALDNE